MAAFNVDADPINRDWLVVARMRVLRAMHPELTDAEVRVVAERAHLASVRASSPTAG